MAFNGEITMIERIKSTMVPVFVACAMVLALQATSNDARADFDAEELTVLPAAEAQTYLKSYLLEECRKRFDARNKEVEALTTEGGVLQRKKAIQEKWTNALCEFPERTPLNPRITGRLEYKTYSIEKVIYESRKDHHVTALLYIPKRGNKPLPGVLVPCGHSQSGKAYAAYQKMCIDLVMHGFVALCYDPIGQGERIQTLAADGKPVMWGTTEHTLADIGARLTGGGVGMYRIWDGIRSLDYLAGRDEVDPERLGCTGNSGGGTMTSYLMATDSRITAAAPSCYITSLERLFNTIGPQDGEQNITAQTALGIEHADYMLMRAPKPTLMLTATHDFFDIDGSWDSFREAKRLYSILGYGERLDLFEYPDEHGFSKPRREAVLRWMRRWLQGIDEPFFETDIEAEDESRLQVTETGQVLRDHDGVSVWDLNLEKAESLAPAREKFWKEYDAGYRLSKVKEIAGSKQRRGSIDVELSGVVEGDGYSIQKITVRRDKEVPIPALLFIPNTTEREKAAVIVVDSRGKAAEAGTNGLITELVKSGHVVLSPDVRGFGETAPADSAQYRGNEYKYSYLAIQLGRPLLGQRVDDVLCCLDFLSERAEVDPEMVSIVGIEQGGPIALHAAYFDKRFVEVELIRSITSWMDVVRTPLCKGQLQQVVPLALRYYDLPDLVKAIKPRNVIMRNPVDAAGASQDK